MSYKDEMTYVVVNTHDGNMRLDFYREGNEVAALYYEMGKRDYNTKPIGYGWVCVEAKYSDPDLYTKQPDLTPTLLLEWGQEVIHLAVSLRGRGLEVPQE